MFLVAPSGLWMAYRAEAGPIAGLGFAALAFATSTGGQGGFATNINNLADPAQGNCKIIVDDYTYFDEPVYQHGLIAQAVDNVYINRDVAYFSSDGNFAAALDVLYQRAAESHVQKLLPAADAEHRHVGLQGLSHEREFEVVATRVGEPELRGAGRSVVRGIDVLASGEQHGVEARKEFGDVAVERKEHRDASCPRDRGRVVGEEDVEGGIGESGRRREHARVAAPSGDAHEGL